MKNFKKKKVAALVLIVLCMFGLCACNKEKDSFGYPVSGDKVTLVPGQKFSADTLANTETISYMEAPSCYFDGLDKVYSYDGFDVVTYPSGDADYIKEIQINKSGINTVKNVGVGSSYSDVIAAYGEDCEVLSMMYRYYQDDNKYLYFFIMNDIVKYYGYSIDVK